MESSLALLDGFAAQVVATPDAAAIGSDRGSLTYRELDRKSNQVARSLLAQGLGAETRIGIAAHRNPDALIALLGVTKARAVCVPIDPSYPAERTQVMVATAKVGIVVGHRSLAEGLGDLHEVQRVVALDHDAPVWQEAPDPLPSGGGCRGADLLYIVFTSGSTGRPKGVGVGHDVLANLIGWGREVVGRRARVTAQFAALGFDVAFEEIWSTWLSGGRLEIVSLEERRDPNLLWQMLDKRRVERLVLPFVALEQLAETCRRRGRRPQSLVELITSGEVLHVTDAIRSAFDGCTLTNEYGPSETHVVTAHRLEGRARDWPALPPIGLPIANAAVYLLDATLTAVTDGETAEIYLGGRAVGRGYEADPARTAERFVPDPEGPPGARMYRTGDLGRRDERGLVHFVGRVDDQIKVRGYRVEPAEISMRLRALPGVRDAVVGARGRGGDQRLVAWVVSDGAFDVTGARAALAADLPDYMVPVGFVLLPKFPLSANGKVDARGLPDGPYEAGASGDGPADAHEALVVEVWKEVLEVPAVGVLDNFFELGGHSLLVLQVIARIEERTGVELVVSDLFEFPTPRMLAAHLAGQRLGTEGG